jgi:hypothetical protein
MRRLLILVLTTRGPIFRYYMGATEEVGSEVAGDKDYTGGVGRVTQVVGARCKSQDARHGRVTGRKAQRKSRDAMARAYGAARFARGVDSPSDEPPSACVRGQEKEEGREGCEEVPVHVAQTGTLTSREGGGSREGAGPRCTDEPLLDRKAGCGRR